VAWSRLPLKLVPPGTDLMEWVCAPSEAAAFKKVVDTQLEKATQK
jgi:hypothetical protein